MWYSMPLSFLFVNLQNTCNSSRYLSNCAKYLFKKTILHWNIGKTHGGPTCHWSNLDLKLTNLKDEIRTGNLDYKSYVDSLKQQRLLALSHNLILYSITLSRVEGVAHQHMHDRWLTYWWVPCPWLLSHLHRLTFRCTGTHEERRELPVVLLYLKILGK